MVDRITKGQAALQAAAYNQGFWQRCFAALDFSAQSGVIGAIIPYGIAGPGSVTAANNILTAFGWTVVQDDIGHTLTVT